MVCPCDTVYSTTSDKQFGLRMCMSFWHKPTYIESTDVSINSIGSRHDESFFVICTRQRPMISSLSVCLTT